MDLIMHHWYKAPGFMKKNEKFWNEQIAWKNKWEKDWAGEPMVGKEKFWFSSSLLVSLTSGWHLMKSIMINCFIGSTLTWMYPAYQAYGIYIGVENPTNYSLFCLFVSYIALRIVGFVGFKMFYK